MAHTGAVMSVDAEPYSVPNSPPAAGAPAMPGMNARRGPPDVTFRSAASSPPAVELVVEPCVETFRPAAAERTPTYSADAS